MWRAEEQVAFEVCWIHAAVFSFFFLSFYSKFGMYGLFVHIYARNGRLFVKLRVVAGREDCYVMQIWPFAWNFFYLFEVLHKR